VDLGERLKRLMDAERLWSFAMPGFTALVEKNKPKEREPPPEAGSGRSAPSVGIPSAGSGSAIERNPYLPPSEERGDPCEDCGKPMAIAPALGAYCDNKECPFEKLSEQEKVAVNMRRALNFFGVKGETEGRSAPGEPVRPHVMTAETLAVKLERWANILFGRYGHPVYLVGSSLNGGGNDVDVRIIIPYDEYWARWPSGDMGAAWAREMGKQSRQGAKWAGANVDLQVQNDVQAIEFKDKPRLRLDTCGEAESSTPRGEAEGPSSLPPKSGEPGEAPREWDLTFCHGRHTGMEFVGEYREAFEGMPIKEVVRVREVLPGQEAYEKANRESYDRMAAGIQRWVQAFQALVPEEAKARVDAKLEAAEARVRELEAGMEQIDAHLTNLQPHIPQACYPKHAAFIDNYVNPCLQIARALRREAPASPRAAPSLNCPLVGCRIPGPHDHHDSTPSLNSTPAPTQERP
jgi:hypothetical protein